MNDILKILVVDNDAGFLKSVTDFKTSAKISTANNFSECIALTKATCFDILVLNIDLNGDCEFEVCEQVKKQSPSTDIILISASSDEDTIVNGYKAGATDYLTKPIRIEELKEKIILVSSFQNKLTDSEKKLHDLEEANINANQVAMSAMTDSSQLGRVLEFMDNNINCCKVEEVATSLVSTCEALGLQTTIFIQTDLEKAVRSSGGEIRPIEVLLIEKVRNQNRIIDFNQRTIFSDKKVSILVKNMPIDNPVEYGRFKDSIMTLACGANSRVKAITNEQLLIASRDSVTNALAVIEENINKQSSLATSVMSDFMIDMESTILVLGLSEEQEEYILSLIDNHLKGVVKIVESAATTQTLLKSALKQLH
ncbi:MAG: response regulator [Pseudomonadales bacterium]|nr:response regulator [Pseudomonadales bacterium]